MKKKLATQRMCSYLEFVSYLICKLHSCLLIRTLIEVFFVINLIELINFNIRELKKSDVNNC